MKIKPIKDNIVVKRLDSVIKQKTGYSLDQLKQVIDGFGQTQAEQMRTRFYSSCQQHGFDPENEKLRNMVYSYMETNRSSVEDTLSALAELRGKPSGPGVDLPATQGNSADFLARSLTGAHTVEDVSYVDAAHADRLSRDGRVITQRPVEEIFQGADKAAKG